MLWAQNRAEPRAQAVLKKMAEPGAILHLPARPSEDAAMLLSAGRYTADNRWPHVQSDILPYTFSPYVYFLTLRLLSRLTITFSPYDYFLALRLLSRLTITFSPYDYFLALRLLSRLTFTFSPYDYFLAYRFIDLDYRLMNLDYRLMNLDYRLMNLE